MINVMKFKKALGIAMTSAMIFTMAMPAFAAIPSATGGIAPPTVAGVDYTQYKNGDNFKITINSKYDGYMYAAYQVFAGNLLEEVDAQGNVTKRTLTDIIWGDGVKSDTLLAELKTMKVGTSTETPFAACATAHDVAKVLDKKVNDSEFAQAFAAVVGKHLQQVAGMSGAYDSTNKAYTITGLKQGYYFVSDLGNSGSGAGQSKTRFIMGVVGDTEATIKMDVTEGIKKVAEDELTYIDENNQVQRKVQGETVRYGEGYNDTADYDIGEDVPFKLIAKIPDLKTYKKYTLRFVDTMDAGLSLNKNSFKVYIQNPETGAKIRDFAAADYVLTTDNATDKNGNAVTFKVAFEDLKSKLQATEISAGYDVVVEFTAKLTGANVVIGRDGNENTFHLEYTNNPNNDGEGETPDEKVLVFTYELDVVKFYTEENAKKALEGAEFAFYRKSADGKKASFVKVDANNVFAGWTDYVSIENGITIPTGGSVVKPVKKTFTENGKQVEKSVFEIIGLDGGTYYLKETLAPKGFNIDPDEHKLEVKAVTINDQNWDGTLPGDRLVSLNLYVDDQPVYDLTSAQGAVADEGAVQVDIENKEGAVLPSTGGMGTTLFYAIGGVLLVGAAVLLVTRKRVEA